MSAFRCGQDGKAAPQVCSSSCRQLEQQSLPVLVCGRTVLVCCRKSADPWGGAREVVFHWPGFQFPIPTLRPFRARPTTPLQCPGLRDHPSSSSVPAFPTLHAVRAQPPFPVFPHSAQPRRSPATLAASARLQFPIASRRVSARPPLQPCQKASKSSPSPRRPHTRHAPHAPPPLTA